MSFKSRDAATRAAKKVLKRMKTPNWKIDVWENLGWHFCLVNGLMTLSESSDRGWFYTLLSDNPEHKHCGSHLWSNKTSYRSPNDAVSAQMELATSVVKKLRGLIKDQRKRFRGK